MPWLGKADCWMACRSLGDAMAPAASPYTEASSCAACTRTAALTCGRMGGRAASGHMWDDGKSNELGALRELAASAEGWSVVGRLTCGVPQERSMGSGRGSGLPTACSLLAPAAAAAWSRWGAPGKEPRRPARPPEQAIAALQKQSRSTREAGRGLIGSVGVKGGGGEGRTLGGSRQLQTPSGSFQPSPVCRLKL